MSAPKPTPDQIALVRELHLKCNFDLPRILAIAEIAPIRTRADYARYIRMLTCYQLFARLGMDATAQTSLIRECGGDELWTLDTKKVARLHEKLTVRLADVVHTTRTARYTVQTLRVDGTEMVDDQKVAHDMAARYEPGTVKAVFRDGNLVGLYVKGVRLEVTKVDMSY